MVQFNIIQPKEPVDDMDQTVINVIEAEDLTAAESVTDTEINLVLEQIGDEGIGWTYNPDNTNFPFTSPGIKLPESFNQAAFKARLKLNVKMEAKLRIEDLAWKIEKATEQDTLNGTNTINNVYAEREAIRLKSNEIEAAIDAETDDMTVFTMGAVAMFDE